MEPAIPEQLPTEMQAAALNEFGGPDKLVMQTVAVPDLEANEVLILVHSAEISEWDPMEREGKYVEMFGKPTFPYIIGSGGAGTVVAVGDEVTDFKPGDQVYAGRFPNPKGGYYAEYAVVEAAYVASLPDTVTIEQAGVMNASGMTALRGLDDTLHLQPGESILIFGAGGGIGHLAVQLAKKMEARVFAVASGEDGVALAKQVGADAAVDGHADEAEVLEAIQQFAPNGLDTALLTAGGEGVQKLLSLVRQRGRVVYPYGIEPEPEEIEGIEITDYNVEADPDLMQRFHRLASTAPFDVHIAQTFPLAQAADGHRALDTHYLGKLALRVGGSD